MLTVSIGRCLLTLYVAACVAAVGNRRKRSILFLPFIYSIFFI